MAMRGGGARHVLYIGHSMSTLSVITDAHLPDRVSLLYPEGAVHIELHTRALGMVQLQRHVVRLMHAVRHSSELMCWNIGGVSYNDLLLAFKISADYRTSLTQSSPSSTLT